MSSLPLSDIVVLVTRPNPAGNELCAVLEAQGAEAIHMPTIAFAPAEPGLLQQAVNQLGEQDWLIFISPQAVYASAPAIRRTWPVFPPQVKFAAIGEGTSKSLRDAGCQVSVCPPNGEWNSEALLSLSAFQDIKGKKIAIIRGEGGRELLANTLEARGARVLPVIAYQRLVPSIDVNLYRELLKQHRIDTVVCASFESVRNFKTMLGENSWQDIQSLPLVVMSERIKNLAHELGFQTIWVARNANHATIVETLVQKRKEICQIKLTKR